MKIIDLLNKIANGEEVPKNIKVGNVIWSFDKKEKTYFMNNTNIQLFYVEEITKKLNDEVEIIEEDKKIEKLEEPTLNMVAYDYIRKIKHKLDEIIDKLNKE